MIITITECDHNNALANLVAHFFECEAEHRNRDNYDYGLSYGNRALEMRLIKKLALEIHMRQSRSMICLNIVQLCFGFDRVLRWNLT